MKKIKGSWCIRFDYSPGINHPVIQYLNKFYGKRYIGTGLYYGVNSYDIPFSGYTGKNEITEQEFLKLTQEMTKEEIENYKDFKKGDILKNGVYFTVVIETLGELIFRSVSSKLEDVLFQALNIYSTTTKQNLYDSGWRLYVEEKSPVVELTLEDIAKKFEIDVANLKIKK